MIENLLYPKKLTNPPQLLVDVETLFNGKNGNLIIPVIGSVGTSGNQTYRLIDVSSDGSNTFRIGFIKKLSRSSGVSTIHTAMPFQVLTANEDEYRCHGWKTTNANLLSTPDKTEVSKSISEENNISVSTPIYNPPSSEHKSLFKMTSDEFAGEGQFSSTGQFGGAYSGVDCRIRYNLMNAYDDFPNSNDYAMVAIEVIVKVKVYSGSDSDGFKVGIV